MSKNCRRYIVLSNKDPLNDYSDLGLRTDYIERIQTNLQKAYKEAKKKYGLSEYKLRILIKEIYGFRLSHQTIHNILNVNHTSMDYACLITLCDFFGFDMNKFLLPDLAGKPLEKFRSIAPLEYRKQEYVEMDASDETLCAEKPFVDSISEVKEKFLVLNDERYTGTFYGYTAPTGESKKTPNEFVLKIKKKRSTGEMSATMTFETTYVTSKKSGKSKRTYQGIPVYVDSCPAVIFFLVDKKNNGEFIQLSFSYEDFPNEFGLLFRHGVVLTGERPGSASLCSKSCLVFNKKISKSKYKYVMGLLKAPNHNFSIPVEEVYSLAEKDEVVAAFLKKHKAALDSIKKEVYMINEDYILNNKASDMSKQDVVKALLLLKQKSKLSYTYHYRTRYRYTSFALKQLAEAEFEVDEETERDL